MDSDHNYGTSGSSDLENCSQARTLNSNELDKLQQQNTRIVPQRRQELLEIEARKNWDLFYKRNSTKFFKDRHWTTREFEELSGDDVKISESHLKVLEVGCGVGNFMFPILKESKNIFFYACDFSPRAVQHVKENPLFDSSKCHPFCCDVTSENLASFVPANSVDIATLIFCLSAIHPDKMVAVLQNIASVLKPDGCVLIRDYGVYDHAMLRFAPGSKLKDNFYVRQDGTRAFYFTKEKLEEHFIDAGFRCDRVEYIYRQTVNHKEGLCVPRVFVQGKFSVNSEDERKRRASSGVS